MRSFIRWWNHARALVVSTATAWWCALPMLICFVLGTWLVRQFALVGTIALQDSQPWLVIVIYSVALVINLAGLIVAIRYAGDACGLWDRLPPKVAAIGRDEPLVRVVSLALLPFIGVYSVFGGIDSLAYQSFVFGSLNNVRREGSSALRVLNPRTLDEVKVIIAIIVVTYLARRLLEWIGERRDSTAILVLAAFVEGFFNLVLVTGGMAALRSLRWWIDARNIAYWGSQATAWVTARLAAISSLLPDFVASIGDFLREQLFPLLSAAFFEPVLWLAAASLVFGTFTMSLSELWTKGAESFDARNVDAREHRASRLRELERRSLHASDGTRTVVGEFVGAFLSDLEARIIPFLQGLRQILKVGPSFLAAYLVVYAAITGLGALFIRGVENVIGPQHWTVWFGLQTAVKGLEQLVTEPLRLTLLAVTITAVLRATTRAGALGGATPVARRRPGAVLATTVVLLASIVAAGAIQQWKEKPQNYFPRSYSLGEQAQFADGQTLALEGVDGGHLIDAELGKLESDAVFIEAQLVVETRGARDIPYLGCVLVTTAPDGTVSRSNPAMGSARVKTPSSGYRLRQSLIYERPAADLQGAYLECEAMNTFSFREPLARIDTGIDAVRAREYASEGSQHYAMRSVTEVIHD